MIVNSVCCGPLLRLLLRISFDSFNGASNEIVFIGSIILNSNPRMSRPKRSKHSGTIVEKILNALLQLKLFRSLHSCTSIVSCSFEGFKLQC